MNNQKTMNSHLQPRVSDSEIAFVLVESERSSPHVKMNTDDGTLTKFRRVLSRYSGMMEKTRVRQPPRFFVNAEKGAKLIP